MKRLTGLLLFCIFCTCAPVWATETWYFRSAGGAACGAGDQESLNASAGSSATTKTLDGTGDTWNRTESARTLQAGNWQACTDLDVGSGGGAPPKVTWLVQHLNSGCSVQATIINEESSSLTKGAIQEACSTPTDPGSITFSAGDILIVTVSQTSGSVSIDLRYEGAASGDADSRLTNPDVSAGVARRVIVVE